MSSEGGNQIPHNDIRVFEDFHLDIGERRITREGRVIPLTPKAFDLLVYLSGCPGQLITKERLLEDVWPDVEVEEANLAKHISQIRQALDESPGSPRIIETVPKQGYRFIASIAEPRPPQPPENPIPPTVSQQDRSSRRNFVMGAVAAVGAISIGGFLLSRGRERIRSLAVLPLRAAEPALAHLARGISQLAASRLSESSGIRILSPSAVHDLDAKMDSAAIGKKLEVDAVLAGTFRQSGERFRADLELTSSAGGHLRWSHSVELPGAELAGLDARVAHAVSVKLGLSNSGGGRNRLSRLHTSNAEAYHLYQRAARLVDRRGAGSTAKAELLEAIALLDRAITLDPSYALAHAQLGYCYVWMLLFIDIGTPAWLTKAEESLDRAQRLDNSIAVTHLARHELFWSEHRSFQIEDAIEELRRAQEIDPAIGHPDLGVLYAHIGLEDLALRHLRLGMALDPAGQTPIDRYLASLPLLCRWEDLRREQTRLKPGSEPVTLSHGPEIESQRWAEFCQ